MSNDKQQQEQLRIRISGALEKRGLEVTEEAIATVLQIMEEREANPVQAIDFLLRAQNPPGEGTPGEINPIEGIFRATKSQLDKVADVYSDASVQYTVRRSLNLTGAKLSSLSDSALGESDFFRTIDCAARLAVSSVYREPLAAVEPPKLVLEGGTDQKMLAGAGG